MNINNLRACFYTGVCYIQMYVKLCESHFIKYFRACLTVCLCVCHMYVSENFFPFNKTSAYWIISFKLYKCIGLWSVSHVIVEGSFFDNFLQSYCTCQCAEKFEHVVPVFVLFVRVWWNFKDTFCYSSWNFGTLRLSALLPRGF